MAIGPGKYDGWVLRIIKETHAEAVAVIVLGGKKGHGFAVKTQDPEFILHLPEILRGIAKSMEDDGDHAIDVLKAIGGKGDVSLVQLDP